MEFGYCDYIKGFISLKNLFILLNKFDQKYEMENKLNRLKDKLLI